MKTQALDCPECGGKCHIPVSELAVGHEVRCEYCAADLCLSRYRDLPDQPLVWHLESSNGFPEEEKMA